MSGTLPDSPQHVLALPGTMLADLRRRLLADAPLESAAFLLARPVRTPAGAWRLVAYEVIDVETNEYRERTEASLELPPEVIARIMQQARAAGASVVLAHSHPGAGSVEPSMRDRQGEALLLPVLRRRVPGVPHARLIAGPTAYHTRLFDPSGIEAALTLHVVGINLDIYRPHEEDEVAAGRFDRQIRAFGMEGQRRLRALRVGIVGLGGTGSVVAQQLAYLGVGSFLLIDPDVLEESNLNRVVGSTPTDVGRPKVAVAHALITSIHPGARVRALQGDVRDAVVVRELLDVDIFFICTDSQGSRAVLTQFAYQYVVPAIDIGVGLHTTGTGVTHISGRVQMLAPGHPCLVCANLLDPEAVRQDLLSDEARKADYYIRGAAIPDPAVISINSTVASMGVTMMLSVVTGIPYRARYQQMRLEQGWVRPVIGSVQPNCPVCSPRGAFAKGDTWHTPGRPSWASH